MHVSQQFGLRLSVQVWPIINILIELVLSRPVSRIFHARLSLIYSQKGCWWEFKDVQLNSQHWDLKKCMATSEEDTSFEFRSDNLAVWYAINGFVLLYKAYLCLFLCLFFTFRPSTNWPTSVHKRYLYFKICSPNQKPLQCLCLLITLYTARWQILVLVEGCFSSAS